MSERLKILLVEDSEPDAELLLYELRRGAIEHESRRVETQSDFERELKAFRPDIILSDFSMPRFNGMAALGICQQLNLDVPFIFVSGTIGEDAAIKAMSAGAHDYVMKGNLARLVPAVQRELREARARQARTIAEAGLRRAQSVAKLAHVITAPDGAFESWSETLPQLIGAGRDKIPASTREWLDLLHPDDRAVFRARSVEAGTRHERQEVDYRLRRGDGTWIHLRQTMEPLSESAGESRWFNTLQDVTEQVRAESDLRGSEAKFRTLIEQAADGIFMTDSQGQFLLANSRYCEMLGYREEELLRMNVADTFPEAERAQARQRIPQLKEVQYRLYERRMHRKVGSSFPAEISVRAIGDGTHQGIARDVTSRKAAEEKIKRLNRVQMVLGQINAVIVRAQDREELFREASRIAVEHGKFRMAWIGVVDQESGLVKPAAAAGDVRDFLESAPLAVSESEPGGHGLAGRAVRDLKPVISNDVRSDPQRLMKKELDERGINSLAIVPLIVGGEAIGVLALYAADVGFFDDEEMKLLLELAGNISFALDHLEKEEKVRRLTRVHAVLTGINTAIVRIRDREALFRESCRIAVEAGQMRMAWIGIIDPRREEVVPAAFSGAEQGLLKIIQLSTREDSGRFGMAGRAIRDRVPSVSHDLAADKRIRYSKEQEERGFRSLAMVPLIVHGAAIGVLGLHVAEAGFFNQDELKLLMEVAGNIAFALEHIDKEEKVQRLTRVYAVLSGINALIVRATDRAELFREACRIAVQAGRFPLALVAVADQRDHRVKAVAWAGDEDGFAQLTRPTADAKEQGKSGLSAQAIESRLPVICNDIEADGGEAMRYPKEALERGLRSAAALPLVIEDKAIGALVLYAAEAGFFDDEEMKLLVELAGDISFALDHLEKAERINYLAYYDALTGLANRALFLERLGQKIRDAGNRKLAVWIVDIERFKAVNDALGRQGGDQLLQQIAARMKTAGKDDTRMARIGADHFAIVSDQAQSENDIARLTESVLQQIFEVPFKVAGQELRISARLGIAMFPQDGGEGEALLRNAEAAVKNAKAAGERYLFFAREMTERIADKLSLENKLRQALEKEEFVLHYQPKVDLATRAIVGVEALIRWQSPDKGLVPPLQFIPLLEETGLILQVGAWALSRAARDHRSWVEQRLTAPRVAVNVSAIQLRQRDFVGVVERAISDGVAPTAIDLEITESLVMEDIKGNIEKLKAVRALGVNIAIDDFGTGYSSLGYLAQLPVQALKIDRSFIIKMGEDPNAMTLVSTIISLAHSLRLKVIAEGVETEDQAKFLRLLRCDEMQGYLFSKPLPAAALVRLLQGTS